jgi:uncharacterized oligopeptide transporter (OPT) family protein
VKELTARAVVAGAAIGGVLAVGNVYLGLKTGLWDAGAITAAILGFAVLAPLARASFGPGEHLVLVTVATAAATTPSVMGLLGAIPALAARPGPAALTLWALALGALGLVVALPLRVLLLERERLPFPTPRAAAEVIAAAHAREGRARALLAAALVAAAITWLRDGAPRWIPGVVLAAGPLGIAVSPMLAGAGVLVGARTGLELLLGAALAWIALGGGAERLVWPGVGVVLGGGLAGLALEWRAFGSLGRDLRALSGPRAAAWLAAAALAVIAVAALALGVPPLLALGGVLLSLPLSAVFLRVAGKTDVAHFGAIGQLAQAGLGAAAPGPAAANVVAGSIAAGSAAQTLQLVSSLRMAQVVGGRPGPLLAASAIGIAVGSAISAQAYRLLDLAYGVGSDRLPAPTAAPWKAMGLVAERGLAAMPAGSVTAAAIGLAAGVALALAGRRSRWIPSPLTVGLAFLIPFAYSAVAALGAVTGALLSRRAPRWSAAHLAPVASGAIAGEALAGIAAALLVVLS